MLPYHTLPYFAFDPTLRLLILSYFELPNPVLTYLTIPYLELFTLPCLTLPYLASHYPTLVCLILSHLALRYPTLPYLTYITLPYLTLTCLALPYPTLHNFTLLCLTLPYITYPADALLYFAYLVLHYFSLPCPILPYTTWPYLTLPILSYLTLLCLTYFTLQCLTVPCLTLSYLSLLGIALPYMYPSLPHHLSAVAIWRIGFYVQCVVSATHFETVINIFFTYTCIHNNMSIYILNRNLSIKSYQQVQVLVEGRICPVCVTAWGYNAD